MGCCTSTRQVKSLETRSIVMKFNDKTASSDN